MIRSALALGLFLITAGLHSGAEQPAPAPPDYRAIVSRADLHYDTPVPRSEVRAHRRGSQ